MTIYVLNYWFLFNVGIQDFKKLLWGSWISYFNKFKLQLKNRVSFSQWCYLIKPFIREDILVEPSPGYSVPHRFPEGNMSRTTIYFKVISYGQTVKSPPTTHNVAR